MFFQLLLALLAYAALTFLGSTLTRSAVAAAGILNSFFHVLDGLLDLGTVEMVDFQTEALITLKR